MIEFAGYHRIKYFYKYFPQIFVLLLSMLVTLQQALSSGYINSVITTIEKRFDIPSSYSGWIASSYEIGNVITVIFVSYLGSRRHIPVWIGIGKHCVSRLSSFLSNFTFYKWNLSNYFYILGLESSFVSLSLLTDSRLHKINRNKAFRFSNTKKNSILALTISKLD